YLTNLFLGEPVIDVMSQYGYVTGKEVEDNATATLSTRSGAIGIVEAGFVNACSPFSVEVHGTEGTLMYGTPDAKLLMRVKGESAWQELELPPKRESAFSQWIGHIQNG